LPSTASEPCRSRWLTEKGLKELEQLFLTIVYHPAARILIADNDRNYLEASVGAGKLLGVPREKIIARSLDDFASPGIKPLIQERWRTLLQEGEQKGTLQPLSLDGTPRDIEYTAKVNVLPVRHLLLLHARTKPVEPSKDPALGNTPAWVQDYALLLSDVDGKIVAWYSGAERIYGYSAREAIGQHLCVLYPAGNSRQVKEELSRAAGEGHKGSEGWCQRKDGSRFWANAVTTAIKDENGDLQGFARVVRDFSDRHERDEKMRRRQARTCPMPAASTIAGVVYGEFDRITDANDTFLAFVGYSREDAIAGRLTWSDLTPREYSALDDFAHEEALLFGACTPFEKELIRKDGTRVPVLTCLSQLARLAAGKSFGISRGI
jgi:formate hydrogenlyase transcriptional activator